MRLSERGREGKGEGRKEKGREKEERGGQNEREIKEREREQEREGEERDQEEEERAKRVREKEREGCRYRARVGGEEIEKKRGNRGRKREREQGQRDRVGRDCRLSDLTGSSSGEYPSYMVTFRSAFMSSDGLPQTSISTSSGRNIYTPHSDVITAKLAQQAASVTAYVPCPS